MKNEIWKEIEGYEGKYLVSSFGRVKSMPNKVWNSERILKPLKQTYSFIDLCVDSKVKKFTIHRLVAKAFIENHLDKPEVNHINGNKHDNRVENLEWVTKSENQKHAIMSGLRHTRGEKNSQCKLSEEKVIKIYNSNKRTSELSKEYNISQPTICDIRKGRSWTHLTNRTE
jgi:hypothetical protein